MGKNLWLRVRPFLKGPAGGQIFSNPRKLLKLSTYSDLHIDTVLNSVSKYDTQVLTLISASAAEGNMTEVEMGLIYKFFREEG